MKIKKLLSIVLALVMVFGLCSTAFAVEQQTTVPEGYIGIYTAEDLNNIRNNLSGKYILMNDIDLSVYENWEPIGDYDNRFNGELDGNGYQIIGLRMNIVLNNEGVFCFGLFGSAAASVIKNILLVDSDISIKYTGNGTATCYAAALVGFGSGVDTLTGCAVSGKINVEGFSTAEIGGIIGKSNMSCPVRCVNFADIDVTVHSNAVQIFVGGISGTAALKETELSNYGDITVCGDEVNSECAVKIGGIDGEGTKSMSLTDCLNRGNISIDFSTPETYIGGISGESLITENAYNVGKITLPSTFVGYAGAISGNIYSSWFGVGLPEKIENAYYNNENLIPAHNAESIPDSFTENPFINVKLLNNEQLKTQITFEGFDFENIWAMEQNGYPVLKNQPIINIKENINLTEGNIYSDKLIESEWTTSNADVATVNLNGEIVAVGAGVATITVNHGYGYTEEITITVAEKPADDPEPTPNPEPNKCFLANLWIVKVIKQLIAIVADIVSDVIGFITK